MFCFVVRSTVRYKSNWGVQLAWMYLPVSSSGLQSPNYEVYWESIKELPGSYMGVTAENEFLRGLPLHILDIKPSITWSTNGKKDNGYWISILLPHYNRHRIIFFPSGRTFGRRTVPRRSPTCTASPPWGGREMGPGWRRAPSAAGWSCSSPYSRGPCGTTSLRWHTWGPVRWGGVKCYFVEWWPDFVS